MCWYAGWGIVAALHHTWLDEWRVEAWVACGVRCTWDAMLYDKRCACFYVWVGEGVVILLVDAGYR